MFYFKLLTYWREHHKGYQWNFYIPNQNEEAMNYMRSKGYLSEDVEIVDVLHFRNYTYQEVSGNFVKITSDNYHLFRELHQHYDTIMYWTSDRILNDIDSWNIYGYIEYGTCLGAIYYMDVGNNMLEIFGIDGPYGVCDLEISKKLLIYCLNDGKLLGYEHMYFFCERDIHDIALELNFNHITDAYSCSGMCE